MNHDDTTDFPRLNARDWFRQDAGKAMVIPLIPLQNSSGNYTDPSTALDSRPSIHVSLVIGLFPKSRAETFHF